MKCIKILLIMSFVIIVTGCHSAPASDGTAETLAEMPAVADEIAELKEISFETVRNTFYDLTLGNDNISQYDNCDDLQYIFTKYYNENGLNVDFKYLIDDETGLKVCAIENVPEGYCLTVYDPVRTGLK